MSTGSTVISRRLCEALAAFPAIAGRLAAAAARDSACAVWPAVAAALDPADPFEAHRLAHAAVFADWAADRVGPPPVWFPDRDALTNSNAARLCADLGLSDWAALHRWSITDRDAFWSAMIDRLGVHFDRTPTAIRRPGDTPDDDRWLPGARLNIVASCFTGQHDAPAIRCGRPDGSIDTWSLAELDDRSARIASGLAALGLPPNAPVAMDMPMTADAVAIYLGIVRAGLCVVSIADSFAPSQIAARLAIADCRVAFTQDVIHRGGKTLPMYAKLVEAGVERCVVVSAGDSFAVDLRPGDRRIEDMLGDPSLAFAACEPDDAINILFSSGTSGEPKAIPWTHTTPLRCAVDGRYHLDVRPGDVVAWPTNLGWMMGPWLIFASLINRATIALYDGAPTEPGFARFVERAGVAMLGVVPSIVKSWRSTGATAGADWSALRCFGSTGECSNADDYFWLSSRARYRPVIEYCGGTEVGGGYVTGSLLQQQSPSTFTTPALGLDFVLLDDDGRSADSGEAYLVGPSIGLSQRLLNRDHHGVYFADAPRMPDGRSLRRHGDRLTRLPGGFWRAEGRADDTMNLGGIKVSSAEIEREMAAAPGIAGVLEVAAVAVQPAGGGPSELVVFYVPAPGSVRSPDAIVTEMRRVIRDRLNPLFRLARAEPIDAIPRTASNKIMRRMLRDRVRA